VTHLASHRARSSRVAPVPERPNWDETWLRVAHAVSRRSLCTRDRVGAVIVDYRDRIVSTGYNGPPNGFEHDGLLCRSWCARSAAGERTFLDAGMPDQRTAPAADYSDCPSLHAEANALMVCDRSVREGGTIYVTSHVCFACAKLIANSGLTRVVIQPSTDAFHRDPVTGYVFLQTCGLQVEVRDVL